MKKSLDIKTRDMLEEIIEKNLNYLVRFATLRLGNKADAEDVVFEAVRKILEADISKIKTGNIRMYLFRIVYNLCKDYNMSVREMRFLTAEDCEVPDLTKDDDLDFEEIERLNGILDLLAEKEAEVIRMHVIDELTFVEISQILGAPPSTVKSRYKSGMEKLRKQYFNKQ